MATEKIKATKVKACLNLWEVSRKELELVVNKKKLQKIVSYYYEGEEIGVILLTKEEMDIITKLWQQKR